MPGWTASSASVSWRSTASSLKPSSARRSRGSSPMGSGERSTPQVLARPRFRHSTAGLRSSRSHGSRTSLIVAFVANLFVAAAKLAAGLITGSAALLAEAAHSFADSTNEVMLAFSFRRSRRPADAEHPFGYGGLRFLWAFLAAISSFLIGGCLSVGLAINDLVHGAVIDSFVVAWIVLGIAALADGTALVQTLRQARREAGVWGQPTVRHLRQTSDPTLRALAVEDTAALIGLALAATDLLIGRSILPARLELARRTLAESPAVDEIRQLYAVHVAPQEVLLAAKVHPVADMDADELAEAMDEIDSRLRAELPEIGEVFIDVTAHTARDGRA